MKNLTPAELHAWLGDSARGKPLLLDVREPWEFRTCRIADSTLMPMGSVPARLVERPQMGFGVPVGSWFRSALGDRFAEAALAPDARLRDHSGPAAVSRPFGGPPQRPAARGACRAGCRGRSACPPDAEPPASARAPGRPRRGRPA